MIHFAVVPQHVAEHLPFGIAFIMVGTAQVAASFAIVAFGVAQGQMPVAVFTLGILLAWGVSRITGLPFGPEAWIPEPLQVADSVAVALEGALLAVLIAPFERLAAGIAGRRVIDVMSVAVVPLVGLIGVVALVAVASIAPHQH